jgi:hypothetical protein
MDAIYLTVLGTDKESRKFYDALKYEERFTTDATELDDATSPNSYQIMSKSLAPPPASSSSSSAVATAAAATARNDIEMKR